LDFYFLGLNFRTSEFLTIALAYFDFRTSALLRLAAFMLPYEGWDNARNKSPYA
jgi:hypothetical protein